MVAPRAAGMERIAINMRAPLRRISVDRLNPAAYNPRKNLKEGDLEYERVKRSMSEFGCVQPLVWNKRTGNLVGGHQRLKVLKDQGVKQVDVVVVDLPLDKKNPSTLP
jgi:ParB-like chromosome segregation protein Spo0J